MKHLALQPEPGVWPDLLTSFVDCYRVERVRDRLADGAFVILHAETCTFGHDPDDACCCVPTLIAPLQTARLQ